MAVVATDMNANPVRVLETCPMRRVFRVFRTMGLRHLIIGTSSLPPCLPPDR
jgi:hypothetical protein